MKKAVSVVLSAAMAISMCAGCGSSSAPETTAAAKEEATEAAGAAEETEAAEAEEKAAEGVMPAVAKEDLKVGIKI